MKSRHKQGMQQMLDEIEQEVRYTRRLIGKQALDSRVMDAMARVPRDAFVPEDLQEVAFTNGPLPIGYGQTISQPYIVALMTDLLAPKAEHRVLEIGSGSGYQTAVLSLLCQSVYSLEIVPELSTRAQDKLSQLGYHNVQITYGNGYQGWPEHAPYDGIIVTAAAPCIPEALVQQLKPGGRLVIPVGTPHGAQQLMLLNKNEAGEIDSRNILAVAFVPMVDHSESKH